MTLELAILILYFLTNVIFTKIKVYKKWERERERKKKRNKTINIAFITGYTLGIWVFISFLFENSL